MVFFRKYNTATNIYIPMIKRAVVDFAVSADWTPAAADVKISKDGGAAANITTLPVAITMGNTAMWNFAVSATELSAAKVVITVADAATKAVEDQTILIETFANASAQFQMDWSDGVRLGLTALPNAAAAAAGGLYTRGSGAGQINQNANGQVDVRVVTMASSVIAAATFAANALDAVWSTTTRLLTAGTNIALEKGTGVTGFNDLSAANVNAEVVDALATDTYAEPGQGAPGATLSLAAKINLLYKSWRNKKDNNGTETKLYADDGTTIDHKQPTSESAGTVTKGEWITGA